MDARCRREYEKRVAWRENQVLKILGIDRSVSAIEPYIDLFYLSPSERLQATVAGHRPSELVAFRDLETYRGFVFGLQDTLRNNNMPNGVLLEALEYFNFDTNGLQDKKDAEDAFDRVFPHFDRMAYTFLQGRYELSTKYMMTVINTSDLQRRALKNLITLFPHS